MQKMQKVVISKNNIKYKKLNKFFECSKIFIDFDFCWVDISHYFARNKETKPFTIGPNFLLHLLAGPNICIVL